MKRIKTERHQVISNYQPRAILGWQDLTEDEREWLDYVDDPDNWQGVRYRGVVYDLGLAMRCDGELAAAGWQGYYCDSAWSAVVIAYDVDEGVIVGYSMCHNLYA
jgi:hypothetical protein